MIWKEIKNLHKELDQDIRADVLVIGGGICGMLTAYHLSTVGKEVVLVTDHHVGDGRTSRSTAVITALQDIQYHQLAKVDEEKARLFLEANLEAVVAYKRLHQNLDFELENVSSYKYASADVEELRKEYEWLYRHGANVKYHEGEHAIEMKSQLQMDPMTLLAAIQNSTFQIFENTKVERLMGNIAVTPKGSIRAESIIIATGYPFLRLKGGFFYKLSQSKSYVMAVKPKNIINPFNAVHAKDEELYFRTYQKLLLVGAGMDRVGKKGKGLKVLEEFQKEHSCKVVATWKNQDTMTLDGLPYIGKYRGKNNWYVATGFDMWGMTGAMISARLLTDLITHQYNRYEDVFSPYRSVPILPVLQQGYYSMLGMLYPTTKRCKHLGCGLKWNEQDGCYECSCHGTTLSKTGEVTSGPANHGSTKKNP